jgi:asparagine synthase (glutamine-hydrolysing)
LSIIDLSHTGHQPISNEDGTVWTVFNGEIYNHRELRHDLELRGHRFRGRSDSEVLPHLYEEMGSELVAKLRGMFALAIYDTNKRSLLLARDRFGIKPLFYTPGTERISFASEIRALLEVPDIDDRPDRQAIYDFAALFYIPAPETFYVGVRALQPGEILEARFDGDVTTHKVRKYHYWVVSPNFDIMLSDAINRADELVSSAVKSQMESDVPLGTLLSGGIDSSLVSSAAQQVLNGRLRTFNVQFPDKDYDETWAAVAVAKHIGSQHKTLSMENCQGTWDHITGLLLHAGQPFADTSLFAANAVCQLMRQHVTVALSGDGGDEGFGGYDLYWQIGRIARLQTLPSSIIAGASLALMPLCSHRIVPQHLSQRVRDLAKADDTAVIQSLFCWIDEQEHKSLCRDLNLLPVRRLFEPQWEYHLPPKTCRVERLCTHASEINTRLTLPNDFLFKVDTASMKESLEIRVPMLDEELFAFGLSLPHYLKVNGRTCKRLLRAIAQRKLPSKVANKPKRGFAVPVDVWVDSDFKACLKDVLLGSRSKLPEFFRPEAYSPFLKAFCEGSAYRGISRQGCYQRAIMLLSVQLAAER